MRKKYGIVIVYVVLVLALIASFYNLFFPRQTKLGVLYSPLYESLEYSLNVIDENMNEITTSDDNSKWAELKETYIKDEQLKETYNLLVEDITECYLLSNDLKNETYDNLKILSFKNKRSISEKQLLKLAENESCLENFDKYNSLTLSDDEKTSEKIKKQISIIIDYEADAFNDEIFMGLLEEEAVNISKIAALTKWLKIEYNSAISN